MSFHAEGSARDFKSLLCEVFGGGRFLESCCPPGSTVPEPLAGSGREAFRQALNAAMPKLLTNGSQKTEGGAGAKTPKDEVREIVERLSSKLGKKDQARLRELAEELRGELMVDG